MCMHRDPYVSFWCPLDDVCAANGTLTLIPLPLPGVDDVDDVDPAHDPAHAVTLSLAAGDAVLFDSMVWHRSGVNSTTAFRRALYSQYSPTPVTISGARGPPRPPLRFGVPCPCC